MRQGRGGLVPETDEERPAPVTGEEYYAYSSQFIDITARVRGDAEIVFEATMRIEHRGDDVVLVMSTRDTHALRPVRCETRGTDLVPALERMTLFQRALSKLVGFWAPTTPQPVDPYDRWEGISRDPYDYQPQGSER